jgi:hypothetical protein
MPNKDEPFLFPSDDDLEEISPADIVEAHGTQLPSPEPVRPEPEPEPAPAARARPASPRKEAPVPVARLTPAAMKAQPAPPEVAPPAPAPRAAEPHRSSFPLLAALLFLAFGFGAGFFAGRLWERQGSAAAVTAAQPPPAPPQPSEPSESAEEPKRTAKPARAAKPSRTARASSEGKGKLDVTAPADAVVYLDGKRIGKGSLKVDVAAGSHRVEVRLGKARVGENFVSEPGMTWTYEVTPK